jgi:hypothetical protein
MTTKYLLPCSCGEKLVVDNRQAGETVQCTCGSQLEVPTMRGLAQLVQVNDPGFTTAPKRVWGPRQGLLFVGLLLATLSFGYAGYLLLFGPKLDLSQIHDQSMKLPPLQVWIWWKKVLTNWAPGMPSMDRMSTEQSVVEARRWMQVSIGVGVCSLLVAVSGLLIRPSRR